MLGPAYYQPIKFTEASHAYSIAPPPEIDPRDIEIRNQRELPGPGKYNNMKEMKDEKKYAKSMLGGDPTKEKKLVDNGVPGPDAYKIGPLDKIPGFVIVQETSKALKEEDKNKEPVGPQRYNPVNPTLQRNSFNVIRTIGTSNRTDFIKALEMPGPDKYIIHGDFEKAVSNPKFHMGIKTHSFTGKNIDNPGPGEYDVDMYPIHHTNINVFQGSSERSDLGIGQVAMYPGPGEYDIPVDAQMDPRIRIAGTFGTQKKDTVIKKTFAPGPGSYDHMTTVGAMPHYLRTEENRRIKAEQDAAIRARLEI